MTAPQYILIEHLPSTNTYVKQHIGELPCGAVVYTPDQTAGRGWGTNKWESEPGRNLAFTLVFKPQHLLPSRQWAVSVCAASGIIKGIGEATGCNDLSIKWPNDIYHGDRKLCGILIEHGITAGQLDYCAIGIGINVNQTKFISDAPNPVSLAMILDREVDPHDLLDKVCNAVLSNLCLVDVDDDDRMNLAVRSLDACFKQHLYRPIGTTHRWENAAGLRFDAEVVDITGNGELVLRDSDGHETTYAFKRVKHVINGNNL